MKQKTYQQLIISHNLGVSGKEITELNHWLRETGVKIDILKDQSRVVIKVFKDYNKYRPEDEELRGI